jgi:hypothetical protein
VWVRNGHGRGRRTYGGGLRQAPEEKERKRVKCTREGGEMVVRRK